MIATETESNKKNLFEQFFGGEFFLIRWWNNLGEFLHQARLIPFIIAVSGYHYFQVLKTHDEVFTAWPVAIFLDLLHYRTVQQAVETRKPLWIIAAVLTTGVAYAFQFIFYSGPGHSGETLPFWQQLLFASVVPIGIAFMVWHHHENEQKVESTLQADFDQSQKDAGELQVKIEELEQKIEAQIKVSEAAQVAADNAQEEAKRLQLLNEGLHKDAGELQKQIEGLQGQLQELQEDFTQLQKIERLWQQLNPQTQLAAQASLGLITIADAAAELAVSTDTVRRTMKRINGHVESSSSKGEG